MAKRVAAAAEAAGAEVRVLPVAETRDPASFAQNPAWTANYEATKDLPHATGDDIVWADVPPGYTDALKFVDGNPYGVSLIAGHDNISEFDDATNTA
jgi:hypothetical protein